MKRKLPIAAAAMLGAVALSGCYPMHSLTSIKPGPGNPPAPVVQVTVHAQICGHGTIAWPEGYFIKVNTARTVTDVLLDNKPTTYVGTSGQTQTWAKYQTMIAFEEGELHTVRVETTQGTVEKNMVFYSIPPNNCDGDGK